MYLSSGVDMPVFVGPWTLWNLHDATNGPLPV
jgi:hypothetical protein